MSLLTDAPEGLLQAMLETSPVGISIVSADGIRVYANPKFAELYRFAEVESAIGHPVLDTYVSVDDHDHAQGIFERDGELASFEVKQLRQDGEEWWCLLDKRRIKFGDIEGYISWHYDITDRKNAEQSALEKADLLELTLGNIDQGIVVRDADDQILLYNGKLAEMLGIPVEYYERGATTRELNELHARQGDVMMTPGAEERRAEWESRRRAGLPVGRLEYERRNAQGNWHFCVRQPMSNGMEVRTFLDITEQRRAEHEAIEKARILQTTLESMGQGLTMYDADWNLVSFNSRYRDHFDLPEDVFQADSTFDDVVGATMRSDYGEDWRDRLTVVRDPTRMTQEWRRSFTRPSGRSVDLLSIPVPSGGFIVTSTDISEIKRVEAELLRQQEINRTVLDAMDQGLLMIDGDGRCQLYNNRICELINVPAEYLDTKPLHRDLLRMQAERGDYRHLPKEERNRLIELMRRLETDRVSFVYERDLADGRILEVPELQGDPRLDAKPVPRMCPAHSGVPGHGIAPQRHSVEVVHRAQHGALSGPPVESSVQRYPLHPGLPQQAQRVAPGDVYEHVASDLLGRANRDRPLGKAIVADVLSQGFGEVVGLAGSHLLFRHLQGRLEPRRPLQLGTELYGQRGVVGLEGSELQGSRRAGKQHALHAEPHVGVVGHAPVPRLGEGMHGQRLVAHGERRVVELP